MWRESKALILSLDLVRIDNQDGRIKHRNSHSALPPSAR